MKKKKVRKKLEPTSLLLYLPASREVRSFSGNLNPAASRSLRTRLLQLHVLTLQPTQAFLRFECWIGARVPSVKLLSRATLTFCLLVTMAGRYGYSSPYSSPLSYYTSYSSPSYYGHSSLSFNSAPSYYGNNLFGGYSASFVPYVAPSKGIVGVTTTYSFNRTELPRTG